MLRDNRLHLLGLLTNLRITIDSTLRLSFIIVLFYQKAKHSIKLYGNQRDEELDDEETDVNSVAI